MLQKLVSAINAATHTATILNRCVAEGNPAEELSTRLAGEIAEVRRLWSEAPGETHQAASESLAALRESIALVERTGQIWLDCHEADLTSRATQTRIRRAYGLPP